MINRCRVVLSNLFKDGDLVKSFGLLFFITAIIFLGCEKNSVATETKPVEVGIIQLKEQSIALEQELSGRVKASLSAEIRPEVSGIVKKVVFKEGQKVKKGDILYEINPDVYKSAYDGANASLQSAKANFEALKTKKARYDELIKFEAVSRQDYD
ncbi:MAG: biotin/lipoyl-binding protein, partial [Campylobacteraceae bacterium]|nr:biotin/lipoyl-binding protein [Campylobacteraceae bacterium]